jgi:hypothetical protein
MLTEFFKLAIIGNLSEFNSDSAQVINGLDSEHMCFRVQAIFDRVFITRNYEDYAQALTDYGILSGFAQVKLPALNFTFDLKLYKVDLNTFQKEIVQNYSF